MEKGDGTKELKEFLVQVAGHVSDRTTQRELYAYHTHRSHSQELPAAVRGSSAEIRGDCRQKPPEGVYVLHGWHDGAKHLQWVKETGLYNIRTESDRGSLRLHESVTGASYLLLHGKGEFQMATRLYRICSEGPRVFSRETLIMKGYPGKASQPYYLSYDVAPLEDDDFLNGHVWDLSKVPGIEGRRSSPIPKKGILLNDLMKAASKKND